MTSSVKNYLLEKMSDLQETQPKSQVNVAEKIIEDYLYAEREPLRDEVLDLLEGDKPSVLERKKIGDRILSKILNFVDTFINGFTGK